MKYIGLDLGSVTCGVAISDSSGIIARVYTTLRYTKDSYPYAAKKVIEICNKEEVVNVVLGNPKHMNGDEGIRSNISKEFKKLLENDTNLKVVLWDERLSSVTVNNAMLSGNLSRQKRRQKKDELAAVVILQGYLDFK